MKFFFTLIVPQCIVNNYVQIFNIILKRICFLKKIFRSFVYLFIFIFFSQTVRVSILLFYFNLICFNLLIVSELTTVYAEMFLVCYCFRIKD